MLHNSQMLEFTLYVALACIYLATPPITLFLRRHRLAHKARPFGQTAALCFLLATTLSGYLLPAHFDTFPPGVTLTLHAAGFALVTSNLALRVLTSKVGIYLSGSFGFFAPVFAAAMLSIADEGPSDDVLAVIALSCGAPGLLLFGYGYLAMFWRGRRVDSWVLRETSACLVLALPLYCVGYGVYDVHQGANILLVAGQATYFLLAVAIPLGVVAWGGRVEMAVQVIPSQVTV